MRKLAKTEPIFVVVIRTNEDSEQEEEPTNEDQIVTVNEDQTRTEYPVQVQELLEGTGKSVCRSQLSGISWVLP